MSHLELLAKAVEYIEQHITEDIHTEDIAANCFCSRSSLEKIFRLVSHLSVRDYIMRRRMTKAAKMLVEEPAKSVLDVAVFYGYSSNEAFTRAFRQVWNQLPSEFRDKGRSSELFPRMIPLELGVPKMNRTVFDISELYDLFRARRDCYFVCCDIRSLIPINEISRKAGDLAIIESMKRMEDAAGPEDIVFRIGGDEFVMLTNSTDEAYAGEMIRKILSHNGECFDYEDQKIPLSLYGGLIKLGGEMKRYDELFTDLIQVCLKSKVE